MFLDVCTQQLCSTLYSYSTFLFLSRYGENLRISESVCVGWLTWCVSCLLCKWTGWNINKCWRSGCAPLPHLLINSLGLPLPLPCVSLSREYQTSAIRHRLSVSYQVTSDKWSVTRIMKALRVSSVLLSKCCDSWSCQCMVMRDAPSWPGSGSGDDNIRRSETPAWSGARWKGARLRVLLCYILLLFAHFSGYSYSRAFSLVKDTCRQTYLWTLLQYAPPCSTFWSHQ